MKADQATIVSYTDHNRSKAMCFSLAPQAVWPGPPALLLRVARQVAESSFGGGVPPESARVAARELMQKPRIGEDVLVRLIYGLAVSPEFALPLSTKGTRKRKP